MLTPTVNPQECGTIAASGDMNNYAYACSFLLNPPMVLAFSTSAQSISASGTAVSWASPTRDNDSTWGGSGSPSEWVLNTQGWYEVAAHVNLTSAGTAANGWVKITTGPSNPAGSGNVVPCLMASCGQHSSQMSLCIAGLIPQLLYVGDIIQIWVAPANACATTNTGQAATWPDYSHRLVSL